MRLTNDREGRHVLTRRLRAALLAALSLAAAALPAAAATQVTRDTAGRAITFDVRAAGADVQGYTALLDGLLHGDEIEAVVVTVVAPAAITGSCGARAAACYRWSSRGDATIFVPALPAGQLRRTLTHEYAHHVDATRPHRGGAPSLDGTAGWWRARGMAGRLARGQVAWDYSLGWNRSIAEIFAEDYTVANLGGASGIGWLPAPSTGVLEAIRADLRGARNGLPGPDDPAGATDPAPSGGTLTRASGRLEAGRTVAVGFAVGASAPVAVEVGGARAGRIRAVLTCGRAPLGGAAARPGAPATIRTAAARGRCRVTLRAVGAPTSYRVVVTRT